MYFSNFLSNNNFTRSLKKKVPIEYRNKAPNEIEITDIKVPSHWPNKIPDIIKIGDPNPRSTTQNIAKMKKYIRLSIIFSLM